MCDCCDVDVAFHESRTRRARKTHRCVECGGLIAPGTKYHYECGVILEGMYSKRFWEAKLCESCNTDWSTLFEAECRYSSFAGCICYGELRTRIQQADEEGWLVENAEQEMYLRWFTPEPEEIGVEPRLLPGGVYPSEAWRLMKLSF